MVCHRREGPQAPCSNRPEKNAAVWEDFWDGLISESRPKEKGISYEQYRASRLKRTRSRG